MQQEVDRMRVFKSKYSTQMEEFDKTRIQVTVDTLIVPYDTVTEVELKNKAHDIAIEEAMKDLH